jgi:hypothetical protein
VIYSLFCWGSEAFWLYENLRFWNNFRLSEEQVLFEVIFTRQRVKSNCLFRRSLPVCEEQSEPLRVMPKKSMLIYLNCRSWPALWLIQERMSNWHHRKDDEEVPCLLARCFASGPAIVWESSGFHIWIIVFTFCSDAFLDLLLRLWFSME